MMALFLPRSRKDHMKQRLLFLSLAIFSFSALSAQGIKDLFDKASKKDSTGILNTVSRGINGSSGSLSNEEIISGLREALKVGTDNSSKRLGKLDGFFKDAAIKILMPEEAKKAERTLRSMGLGSLVDKAILSMNRAAEDAATGVGNIFWNAIRQMSIKDGLQILKGGDFAATEYLKKMTTAEITAKFRPVIDSSLAKTEATRYWKDVFTAYNRFSRSPINTDLTAYVTERALNGIFYNIGLEEQKIRKDPAAQVTSLLKKVFGSK